MNKPRTRFVLSAIVIAYVLLACVYANVTPIFEAPDEVAHFEYVRFLALRRSLPTEARPNFPDHIQTAGHPPLYYALGALIAPKDALAVYAPRKKNPYFAYGSESLGANVMQPPPDDAFPYRGVSLAVHLLRAMSILFGAGTIGATYWLARVLLPSEKTFALCAAALAAFVPQFVFISASINSDNLVNFLCALALVQIVRAARDELRFPRDAILLGVTVGLAVLAKASALVLVPIALLAFLFAAPRAWLTWLRDAGFFLATFFLIAGWWFVRNLILFGDPLAMNWWAIAYASARRTAPFSFEEIPYFLNAAWISFWANFGWGNLNLEEWIYFALAGASAIALGGLILRLVRRERAPRGFWILPVDVSAVALLFIWYFYSYPEGGTQGRYMFTALAPLAILGAYGLSAYLPTRYAWVMPGAAAASLFALTAVIPFALLVPAYQPFHPPEPIARAQVPADAARSEITFRAALRVFAFSTSPTFQHGMSANVRIYWEPLTRIATDNNVGLSLVSADGTVLWERARRPGRGLSPSDLWKKGTIIPDIFTVRVPDNAPRGQAFLRVNVAERSGEVWATAQGETNPILATVTIE